MHLNDVVDKLNQFVRTSPLNQIEEIGISQIFDRPSIGVSDAKDPLYAELKKPEVISPHYLLPQEWLNGAQSIISYFLPFSKQIREANRSKGLPATEWLYGRIEGEALNNALRSFLVSLITEKGAQALAPAQDSRFSIQKRRSNWSERHVAFISGLGTFGLSKSLITEKGCAGRYGSVITTEVIPATPRPYSEIYEYCTMCGECIPRCPSGAITMEGKDVTRCSEYMDTQIKPRFTPRYGCGKCQNAVPCEWSRP
jgi:epoxyqueuosine reductase